jgi:enoyl-CoA hydratase
VSAEEPVGFELRGGIAVLRVDDGKANAVSFALLDAANAALDRAEKEARAAVLLGRPERFSGGFDLGVMRGSDAGAIGRLVVGGGRLALRLYGFPLPLVVGCTGHALAMGAVLLLAGDLRIGTSGDYKIGLNEVAIGLTLPPFARELARERLSPPHLQRATALAEIYDPAGAVEAGFLDRTVAAGALEATALAEAERLAELHPTAHRNTKRSLRAAALEAIGRSLDESHAAIGRVAS